MAMDDITQKVSDRYARAASTGEQMCCPTGYNFDDLRSFIPDAVLKISYGCGTPAGLDTVQTGETVLDIGSGGGIDCFEAARRVGSAGRVIGIDMTDTMLEIARRNAPVVAANLGYPQPNTEFRKGMADAMPVEDASVDLIISNCVINLAPDKRKVFREMYRVLKPGGRFTISDIVSDQVVPQYLVHDSAKWGDCLSGALQVQDYIGGMVDAGFRAVHQIKSSAWQSIDGVHFLSVTLTGYKLPAAVEKAAPLFATLCGPFSTVTDELGQQYTRGSHSPSMRSAHNSCEVRRYARSSSSVRPRSLSMRLIHAGPPSFRSKPPASGRAPTRFSPDRSSAPKTTIIISTIAECRWRSVRRLFTS